MKSFLVIIFLCISLLFLLLRCTQNQPAENGKALAKIHCVSCHAYPEPALLDQATWKKYILPRMGVLLGVLPMDSAGATFIEPHALPLALKNASILRKEPSLSLEEWATIRDFYLKNAPEKVAPVEPLALKKDLPQFKVKFPNHFLSPPSTTLVKFLNGHLFVGDAHTKRLYLFDKNLDLQSMTPTGEAAVSLHQIPEGDLMTSMGSFSPTDQPSGSVLFLPKKGQPKVLLDSLKRPVHTELADLDGDGRFDLVTCEFAKWTGSLCWWKNDGKGNFQRHVLRNMPGAIRAYVRDLNSDNLPDIISLFGQGDEGILIFYNEGGGKFREERALQFPPSYGSSYFSLFDFNGDAHPDLIYTCGDNADFPPILKPYHGIRIFENDGKNQFKEAFFYPMPGAYAAIPADFDLDGDLDLAAISFFPDFENAPEAGFVFLENQGDMKFQAVTFPAASKGRWLVLDAGDLDSDGDLDLVLGALAFEVVPDRGQVKQWVKDGIPFVVLENQAR